MLYLKDQVNNCNLRSEVKCGEDGGGRWEWGARWEVVVEVGRFLSLH